MNPAILAFVFDLAMRAIDSVAKAQGGKLTDEQMDQLRASTQAAVDRFNELTKDAAP